MSSKVTRRPPDRFDERRRALAESALVTLGELGYARTTLREIAHHSDFSHGVVHYYFEDKLELIVSCVGEYKSRCAHRYDVVVEDATTPEDLLERFCDRLAETLVADAPMHRLWYDLRSQSMFEESLREPVTGIDRTLEEMVWRVVTRYAELAGVEVVSEPSLAYGMLDGVFQQALLGYHAGRDDALGRLRDQARRVLCLAVGAED